MPRVLDSYVIFILISNCFMRVYEVCSEDRSHNSIVQLNKNKDRKKTILGFYYSLYIYCSFCRNKTDALYLEQD